MYHVFRSSIVVAGYTGVVLAQALVLVAGCGSQSANLSDSRYREGRDISIQLGKGIPLELAWLEEMEMWVGRYEVSVGQFRKYLPDHQNQPSDPDRPVVWVTAKQALRFCAWLNRRHAGHLPRGFRFRLPDEKEWATFAGCGDQRTYPWGNSWPPTPMADGVMPNLGDSGLPVHKSGMNEWGLYGVAGNVAEICSNLFDPADKESRVIRGWSSDDSEWSQISSRGRFRVFPSAFNPFAKEGDRLSNVGFRVVLGRTPKPVS